MDASHPLRRLARMSRRVAVALGARLWPTDTQASLEARLMAQPVRIQAALVAAALSILLLAAVLAAQFGWVGLLVYFVAVIAWVG